MLSQSNITFHNQSQFYAVLAHLYETKISIAFGKTRRIFKNVCCIFKNKICVKGANRNFGNYGRSLATGICGEATPSTLAAKASALKRLLYPKRLRFRCTEHAPFCPWPLCSVQPLPAALAPSHGACHAASSHPCCIRTSSLIRYETCTK